MAGTRLRHHAHTRFSKDTGMATEEIHTYCPMCVAQCGVVAMVEDGRFTKVTPDSGHPNGGICIKGYSAPEIVYSPDRLLHP
jgi:anaerobic selenocysteine-containing dehydrogenase